ncbi:hypothetical protein OG887_43050 (plasmid) [Streptomyces sp. NBC_00053]|uniref:hypothetical protein n=1 Tax=unclassified Streptomyces TaxID=2593676 RepID=UPI002257117D|nr:MULTISPECIES: hypothetical protein [unclassified Streptomyces]MCX4400102.1 hypothetical protein [Streptomyces sp. NBC_01767]MCX4902514.1 hypothetical protein [Streptomyces sp. NBC_00892]MCX5103045.1 hypothetical protein [Streptomyces sp. NBC_00439]MCX5106664.1 hypothetical protein [Streptomyces sp. NBC_00439]MCX5505491.1 hypothetical protein [Streptomyces sp. NBC_00052]
MDGKTLVDFFNKPGRYPDNIFRGDSSLDPVHFGDLKNACERVSQLVEQLRLDEFCLRTENWTGLVVVYAMDKPEPRGRLRSALEEDGFEVTERRNEYGISLEVHLQDRHLIHTRYDFVVNTIAEVMPDAATITDLQEGVTQRLGHPVPTGLLHTQIQIFNMSLMMRRQGVPRRADSTVPEGLERLVTAAFESDVIPPLCTRLPIE